jgi:hypothetical protein
MRVFLVDGTSSCSATTCGPPTSRRPGSTPGCWASSGPTPGKDLATLRVDRSLLGDVDDLRWTGPAPLFAEACDRIDAGSLAKRAAVVAAQVVRPD